MGGKPIGLGASSLASQDGEKRMKRAGERQSVDIEELLITAYRRNYVDRVSVMGILAMRGPSATGVSSTALVMAHVARGTAVDTSTAGATFAGRAGQMQSVEDDLIEVHDAVLGLPTFYADLLPDADFVLWDSETIQDAARHGYRVRAVGPATSPGYLVAEIGALPRPIIGRGPRAYRNGRPLPVLARTPRGGAVTVAMGERRQVRGEGAPERRLHPIEPATVLVANGRAGTRPVPSGLVVEKWRPFYQGRDKRGIGMEPVWQVAPSVVALERATYAAWHTSLCLLAARLRGLARYEVSGPAAPAWPWRDDDVEYQQLPKGMAVERLEA